MTTPTTPYDTEIDELTIDIRTPSLEFSRRARAQSLRWVLLDKSEGYLRALADMQPRLDALVAALGAVTRRMEEDEAAFCGDGERKFQCMVGLIGQARVALWLAGKG